MALCSSDFDIPRTAYAQGPPDGVVISRPRKEGPWAGDEMVWTFSRRSASVRAEVPCALGGSRKGGSVARGDSPRSGAAGGSRFATSEVR